jgi:hypothetical protein
MGVRNASLDIALTYDLDIPGDLRFEPLATLPPYVLVGAGHPIARAEERHCPHAGRPAHGAARSACKFGVFSVAVQTDRTDAPDHRTDPRHCGDAVAGGQWLRIFPGEHPARPTRCLRTARNSTASQLSGPLRPLHMGLLHIATAKPHAHRAHVHGAVRPRHRHCAQTGEDRPPEQDTDLAVPRCITQSSMPTQCMPAWSAVQVQAVRSKRSAFITFVQAATKSLTNFSLLSSWA